MEKRIFGRRFCPHCFTNGNIPTKCTNCERATLCMSYFAQPPRKNASKKRWRDFFGEWYPSLNFEIYWKARKEK